MNNLEKKSKEYTDAYEDHVYAKSELDAFEKGVRKHGYQKLITASNSQKMNLEFEHLIAGDNENWKHWQQLINDVNNTDVKLFSAKTSYETHVELFRNGKVV